MRKMTGDMILTRIQRVMHREGAFHGLMQAENSKDVLSYTVAAGRMYARIKKTCPRTPPPSSIHDP